MGALSAAAQGADKGADKLPVHGAGEWAAMAKWPDFMTGMWAENYNPMQQPRAPLTAAAQARADALAKNADGNGAKCLPLGMPGMMMPGYPMAFYFTRGSIFIISDMDDLLVRRIIMDSKEHGDPDPSWNGHSIGHWEGGTLVIDTAAIIGDAPLSNLPSQGQTHIVERIRMTGPDAMEWKLTITNPALLSGPWQLTKTYVRHADWQLEEASCTAGNRDTPAADGSSQVNLKPPK